MANVYQLSAPIEGITCHTWNADRSMIAFSPNSNLIHIYDVDTWKKLFTLSEHDLHVSAIDWSPVNNKIVSCSHDRNAFVWTYQEQQGDEPAQWKPTLVILQIDRAALDVKWSLDGLRFAVTSSSKTVPICMYESKNDWWISKIIKKKFKSSVTCCAFHPLNGQVIACGSTDSKCRLYSCYISDVDGDSINAWPLIHPLEFGEMYLELKASGWINAVAWSPSGNVLAFTGQDSSLHCCTFYETGPVTTTIRFNDLPLNSLLFTSEKSIVGGGYDFNPLVFAQSLGDDSWSLQGYLDEGKKNETDNGNNTSKSGIAAARDMFKAKASTGLDRRVDTITTHHDNVIRDVHNCGPPDEAILSYISTSGNDGKVIVWDLNGIPVSMESLKL